jgi:hypothetical protein
MSQVDPWEKAADCERAIRLTIDPIHSEDLTNIREFWISLANKRRSLTDQEFANQAEAIGRIHSNLTAATSIRYVRANIERANKPSDKRESEGGQSWVHIP